MWNPATPNNIHREVHRQNLRAKGQDGKCPKKWHHLNRLQREQAARKCWVCRHLAKVCPSGWLLLSLPALCRLAHPEYCSENRTKWLADEFLLTWPIESSTFCSTTPFQRGYRPRAIQERYHTSRGKWLEIAGITLIEAPRKKLFEVGNGLREQPG